MPAVTDNVAIVGVGETPVGKLPDLGSVQIQAQAVLRALEDAGLGLRDLDGLVNLDPYTQPNSMFAVTLAEYLGINPSFLSTVDVGGTVTAMTMLQQAVWALESGYCKTVACVYGENSKTGRPPAMQGLYMGNLMGGEEWEEPFGCQGMVIPYALLAQRYFEQFGAGEEDLAAVAMNVRRHAQLNPNAQRREPMTMEDYLGSRMISTPLRLFDCSLVSDGGGAVILTTRDRAMSLGVPPVTISAIGVRATHNSVAQQPDIEDLGMAAAGRDAFAAAGLGPHDMDVLELHDAFTISVLVTLDALGYSRPGEAGALVRSGATGLGGRWPLNTHGGLLSQAHIGGILHVTEAVQQLRGRCGPRQVDGASRAIVSGNGGIFSVCGVMILQGG
jgi:acetyl-CoA acetyltransferase